MFRTVLVGTASHLSASFLTHVGIAAVHSGTSIFFAHCLQNFAPVSVPNPSLQVRILWLKRKLQVNSSCLIQRRQRHVVYNPSVIFLNHLCHVFLIFLEYCDEQDKFSEILELPKHFETGVGSSVQESSSE
ncbi:hypothetical protein BKA63DRAFT_511216 [Paraphoma chrysanthemicola]|nr:hypothetical protein BKA63DRAFT_511216 [Paraphoma chrysanthemicola]